MGYIFVVFSASLALVSLANALSETVRERERRDGVRSLSERSLSDRSLSETVNAFPPCGWPYLEQNFDRPSNFQTRLVQRLLNMTNASGLFDDATNV